MAKWDFCENLLSEIGVSNDAFSLMVDNMNEHEVDQVTQMILALGMPRSFISGFVFINFHFDT